MGYGGVWFIRAMGYKGVDCTHIKSVSLPVLLKPLNLTQFQWIINPFCMPVRSFEVRVQFIKACIVKLRIHYSRMSD